jgi:hypothetical protein
MSIAARMLPRTNGRTGKQALLLRAQVGRAPALRHGGPAGTVWAAGGTSAEVMERLRRLFPTLLVLHPDDLSHPSADEFHDGVRTIYKPFSISASGCRAEASGGLSLPEPARRAPMRGCRHSISWRGGRPRHHRGVPRPRVHRTPRPGADGGGAEIIDAMTPQERSTTCRTTS